jgi:hypothetical protein
MLQFFQIWGRMALTQFALWYRYLKNGISFLNLPILFICILSFPYHDHISKRRIPAPCRARNNYRGVLQICCSTASLREASIWTFFILKLYEPVSSHDRRAAQENRVRVRNPSLPESFEIPELLGPTEELVN